MNNLAFQIYGSIKSGIFQSTWKTDNAGISSSTQIELPLVSGGTYNFWIDWGDGSTTNVTSYSQRTHTYSVAGTYTLRATGTVGIWQFNNGGDKLKILTIASWGKLKLGSGSFNGCSNVTMSGITDIPDLTGVTSLVGTFQNCSSITTIGRINEWNVSNVTIIDSIFRSASSFNQNLSNWNVSKVTNYSDAFNSAVNFNNGYASGVSNQLTWTINTISASVTMSGMFYQAYAFNSNLGTGTTPWDMSKVTVFTNMFAIASNFNNGDNSAPINNWAINTVSNVSMFLMFAGAVKFNRYISGWNTSKVNTMNNMFAGASIFNNGYLSAVENQLTWDTSACTNMGAMFSNATAFNSNLGTGTTPWNVSKVTTFQRMCNAANFNNGDEATLSKMNDWNIGGDASVTSITMTEMFQYTTAFNRDISGWNMTKVNNISSMFFTSIFNQPLSNWERVGSTMSSVTDMSNMFRLNTAFNQPIGNWNTISVTGMGNMFSGATAFNQNIGSWNVSNVTNFSNFMLGKTNINFSSTNLDAIYNGWSSLPSVKPNISISFGTAKYTAAGTPGKNILIGAPNNWTITDGGI